MASAPTLAVVSSSFTIDFSKSTLEDGQTQLNDWRPGKRVRARALKSLRPHGDTPSSS